MQKLLVAGARGMLGRRVVELAAGMFEVTGIDIEECDITDAGAVREVAAAAGPDILVNCAAMTDVDGCESRFEEALSVNGDGAANLAAAAAAVGAPILHVSTDYVFDGTKTEQYVEDDPVSPLGAYGRTKLAGEEGVRKNNPGHWIVRTQWLYGPDGKNFVDTILRVASEKMKTADPRLEVVDDQIGSPTYSVDLARQLLRIAAERPPFGIYHCSSKGACSWYEFASKIIEISGMAAVAVDPISSEKLQRPAPRPANSIMRNLRLEETIGDGMPHWIDALGEYMKFLGYETRSPSGKSSQGGR